MLTEHIARLGCLEFDPSAGPLLRRFKWFGALAITIHVISTIVEHISHYYLTN
jgi:hypothetical protein